MARVTLSPTWSERLPWVLVAIAGTLMVLAWFT